MLHWRYKYKFFAYVWNLNVSKIYQMIKTYMEKYGKFHYIIKMLTNNINSVWGNDIEKLNKIEFKLKHML